MESETSLAAAQEERLQEIAQKSDLVFTGTVVSVGEAPGDWSGYTNTYQTVRYKVDRVLKGKETAREISVDHVVVYGGLTAQPGETPGLSTELFSVNAKLIVLARKAQSGAYKGLNENYSAVPATAEWLKKVESALRSK